MRRLDPRTDVEPVDAVLTAAYGRPSWRADLEDHLALQPDGWFVAQEGDGVVAVGGATDYGPFGWIGLVGVLPAARRRGLGRLVTTRCVEFLAERGSVPVLDASDLGAGLYRHMGFTDVGPTRELVAPAVVAPALVGARVAGGDLDVRPLPGAALSPELVAYDTAAFGADRRRVLDRLVRRTGPGRCLVARRGPVVVGYVLALGERLGPWVADDADVVRALAAAGAALPFPAPPRVQVPPDTEHLPVLEELGFTPTRTLRHMRLGETELPGRRSRTVGEASYALG